MYNIHLLVLDSLHLKIELEVFYDQCKEVKTVLDVTAVS